MKMAQKISYIADADGFCLTLCPHRVDICRNLGIRRVGSFACVHCEHCDQQRTMSDGAQVVYCCYPKVWHGKPPEI